MNKRFRWFAVVAIFLFSEPVSATNGYWSHGYGPKSKAIAGACVAMVFEPCVRQKPRLSGSCGDRLEFGAALFAPKRGFVAMITVDHAIGRFPGRL